MNILNLTQHAATEGQLDAGVIDPSESIWLEIEGLLTFESNPTQEELEYRARRLANIAANYGGEAGIEITGAMIGGAPYLMSHLAEWLREAGIQPMYAFTKRESEDLILPDGSVSKVSIFRHGGFVPA